MLIIEADGKTAAFTLQEFIYTPSAPYFCALCGAEIKNNEMIYIIYNCLVNMPKDTKYFAFPNHMVHSHCADTKGLQQTAQFLEDDYAAYQRMKEQFKHWRCS